MCNKGMIASSCDDLVTVLSHLSHMSNSCVLFVHLPYLVPFLVPHTENVLDKYLQNE